MKRLNREKNSEIADEAKEEMKDQFRDEDGKYPDRLRNELAKGIVEDIEDNPQFWMREKVKKLQEDGILK